MRWGRDTCLVHRSFGALFSRNDHCADVCQQCQALRVAFCLQNAGPDSGHCHLDSIVEGRPVDAGMPSHSVKGVSSMSVGANADVKWYRSPTVSFR